MTYKIEDIERIVYWWSRYEGKRTPKGKVYDQGDMNVLIMRLNRYLHFPKHFDFSNGVVVLPEDEE